MKELKQQDVLYMCYFGKCPFCNKPMLDVLGRKFKFVDLNCKSCEITIKVEDQYYYYNKVIQEFMVDRNDWRAKTFHKGIAYHQRWDWIMKVVQNILPPHGWELELISYQNDIIKMLGTASMIRVHKSVYDFIRAYTKLEQNKPAF